MSAAREVALTKPIIVIKPGRTEAAAKAAASHTGSLTGSDEVLQAAFQRVGVLRVEAISELFDMAEVLSKQPRPRGPHLTIVTNAGGPGVLATDMLNVAAARTGPTLRLKTMEAFNKILPPTWSHNTPVDIIGDAKPELYAKSLEIAANDPNTDGIPVILTPQAMTDPTATADCLKPFAHIPNKPVIASWMGADIVAKGEDILNAAQIPTFKYPDRAAKAFYYMWRYNENLRQLYETPAMADDSNGTIDREKAAAIIAEVRKSGRTILTEFESKKLLAAYGIPTVETHIALTENDAVKEAARLGFPVVLKLHSETITHKTDVDGVQLNLRTAEAVREAWKAIETSCTGKAGKEHFLGVTVQPMIKLDGYEIIIGSSIDPQFGPVLLFKHRRPARGGF